MVLQIPIHKTEQYPLPAMHIDESSLEGTLGVLDKIICVELGLTEDDIKKHGIIPCAGDQLSKLLLDKVCLLFLLLILCFVSHNLLGFCCSTR